MAEKIGMTASAMETFIPDSSPDVNIMHNSSRKAKIKVEIVAAKITD